MKSGAGDVLPNPGRGDSWAPLALWGSGCLSEHPNVLNVPSSLDKMLRVLAWGNDSGHGETCQWSRKELLATGTPSKKYFCPLSLLFECPSGYSNSILAQLKVLFIIYNG